ncbi:HNH endonuclease [Mesomycoplasma ovipneumoniae]|uniref:HNH endonuclease n=1 Tax=Mesomycoplasma ovipneumoniae TaxID=29562 RepID=A0AAJ2P2W0_9BACT|nr:HNH endonuclease [Mesomycoplasma ovipneumoniae]MDW2835457.1 HNH endonuclease [Mesomycoplasma ovipneumoniae]MDW2852362.1 HNH endonuclease [Mesomycoplasma ovipneumoniae]MDW2861924.1 HNH endonuclease [Mesomycoplasma ovipneumoniae]MDW2890991.1 HNH endonuclease [Mesomycoplasma ovipneumoniae]MDW2892391.1 HNH endonuclease [Mesomycoplasma ovipneumoniae]
MSKTLRWNKLKIKSKSGNKDKPQFKGEIFFVYDIESLVIHHFYIKINSCVMSKLVTQSHREDHEQKHINKTSCCYYKKREEFFNSLEQKVVQKDRKNRSKIYNQDNLQILNNDEIKRLNKLLREANFLTTIKNLYKFIYGSNPGGELFIPKNAPIILDDEENFDKNISYFALFFTYYSDFNNNYEYDGKYDGIYKDNGLLDDKNYFDRFKDAPKNSKLYKVYQSLVELTSDKLSIESGKKVLAEIKKHLSLDQINSLVKNERKKMKNIKIDSINILDLDKQMYLDRAHIFPVERIKDEIVKLVNRESYKLASHEVRRFVKKITEAHNLIALDKNSHTQFDRNKFTWDSKNGKLVIKCCNSPQTCEHISDKITDLPKEKITDDILNNLNLRNSGNI